MFIDIHVHARRQPGFPRNWLGETFATPEQLISMYDERSIDTGVILPMVSPEGLRVPQSLENVLLTCEEYPGRFIPFCNLDPRMITNTPDAPLGEFLLFYQDKGCKGVGEIMANLPFDHPMVDNMFRCCEATSMPVIFHVATRIGGMYGLLDHRGLPLLERALDKFPELTFLGHSQAFWSEIAPIDNDELRGRYPTGPIESPGRVVTLMRNHDNLHGDLSAKSGFNAISRDREFGISFLNEFQDRLYFGTDITSPRTTTPLVDYLIELRDHGELSASVFNKIARGNAKRLLGI